MMRDPDSEAEAFTVWQQHGERAPSFVAQRINDFASGKNPAEAERWRQIAGALDALMTGERN